MKVDINISPEINEPYVVIHTREMTNDIASLAKDITEFTKMVVACIITGLGFGVPTFLYSKDNVPMFLASIIHLGIGFTVYFIAAANVGWIPTSAGITASVVTIVGVIVIGIIIWLCFLKYNKNLADKMNKAISEKR